MVAFPPGYSAITAEQLVESYSAITADQIVEG
jgi:hypothetical protein